MHRRQRRCIVISGVIMEKINIRGIDFDNVTLPEAVDMLTELAHGSRTCVVVTPNAEIVQKCIEEEEFADIVRRADVILPDGVGVIKAARILATPLKSPVPGVEVGEALVKQSGEEDLPVFLMGGKPGVAEIAAEKLKEKYPDAKIAGTHHGYFAKTGEENDAVIDLINESGARILFVCIGVPAQEKWMIENRERLQNVRVMLGLGGSLDVYSGTLKRAPAFFRKLGLEWLYRLIRQPKRIGRMMKLPKFYFGTKKYKKQLDRNK